MKNQQKRRDATTDLLMSALLETIVNMTKTIDSHFATTVECVQNLVLQVNQNYKRRNVQKIEIPQTIQQQIQQQPQEMINCLQPLQKMLSVADSELSSRIRTHFEQSSVPQQQSDYSSSLVELDALISHSNNNDKPQKNAPQRNQDKQCATLACAGMVAKVQKPKFNNLQTKVSQKVFETVRPKSKKLNQKSPRRVSPTLSPKSPGTQILQKKYSQQYMKCNTKIKDITNRIANVSSVTVNQIQLQSPVHQLSLFNPCEAENNMFQFPPNSEFSSPLQVKPIVHSPKIIRRKLQNLPQYCLALIACFEGYRQCKFIFVNTAVFKQTLLGQIELYEAQRQQIQRQIEQLNHEINTFTLSKESNDELMSITHDSWQAAIDLLPSCRQKDITILKLYFTALDQIQNLDVNSDSFIFKVQEYMSSNQVPQCLQPSLFNLKKQNCERLRLLLINLQKNQVNDQTNSSPWIESLTNVLFEVLQFVGIIPGNKADRIEQFEELKSVAAAIQEMRNNLIDFRNLVQ